MDLLGSILNKMDKPPSIGEQQKKALKKQKEDHIRKQEEERNKLKTFKKEVESKINSFVQNDALEKLKLQPMNKVQRSIVHEIAEIAGLSAFSFGEEDIDRHVVIFKKEFTPCQDELNAYRRGQPWNPETNKQKNTVTEESDSESPPNKKFVHTQQYTNRYERLIGKEAIKEAVKVTEVSRKYGFVSSENKKDQRSIEQTLADIRAKKRLKKDD